jgi:hypothetical protein
MLPFFRSLFQIPYFGDIIFIFKLPSLPIRKGRDFIRSNFPFIWFWA